MYNEENFIIRIIYQIKDRKQNTCLLGDSHFVRITNQNISPSFAWNTLTVTKLVQASAIKY